VGDKVARRDDGLTLAAGRFALDARFKSRARAALDAIASLDLSGSAAPAARVARLGASAGMHIGLG
jgi:hypothetical protein